MYVFKLIRFIAKRCASFSRTIKTTKKCINLNLIISGGQGTYFSWDSLFCS
jgi:hypothetical protein